MTTIIEPTFEVAYAIIGLFLSIFVLIKGRKRIPYIIMASIGFSIVLTDSMVIIPKYLGLSFLELENFHKTLGMGSAAMSITLSLIYVAIYALYKIIKNKNTPAIIDITVIVLAASKVIISIASVYGFELIENYYLVSFLSNIPLIGLGFISAFYTLKWTSKTDDELYKKISLLFASALLSYTFVLTFKNSFIPLIIVAFGSVVLLFFPKFIGLNTIVKQE